jgi:hypothetical protein
MGDLAVHLNVSGWKPGQRFDGRRASGADTVELTGRAWMTDGETRCDLSTQRIPNLVEGLLEDVPYDLSGRRASRYTTVNVDGQTDFSSSAVIYLVAHERARWSDAKARILPLFIKSGIELTLHREHLFRRKL